MNSFCFEKVDFEVAELGNITNVRKKKRTCSTLGKGKLEHLSFGHDDWWARKGNKRLDIELN